MEEISEEHKQRGNTPRPSTKNAASGVFVDWECFLRVFIEAAFGRYLLGSLWGGVFWVCLVWVLFGVFIRGVFRGVYWWCFKTQKWMGSL